MKKRIISITLCLIMLLSFTVTPVAANDADSNSITSIEATDVNSGFGDSYIKANNGLDALDYDTNIAEEQQLNPVQDDPHLSNYIECPTVDLSDSQVRISDDNSGYVILPDTPTDQSLDTSHVVDITSELVESGASPIDSPENQAPVADPFMFVGNPESMRDGKYTTDTWIMIATRWNNQDLCYDPEGGPLSLVTTEDFPLGYITPVADTDNGTWAGFVVKIFNTGNYPFLFAFADNYGGISRSFYLDLDIISRGVFETISGSVAAGNTETHTITVDYSSASEYTLGILRKSTTGFIVTVYNPDGTECGKASNGIVRDQIILPKPSGVTGEYTYTVSVSTYVNTGEASYKLAYGPSNQSIYFFEDVSDSVVLPYYETYRDYKQQANLSDTSRMLPSNYGDYYEITATGTERVTLETNYDNYCFKILDYTSLETLYDGANLSVFKPDPSINACYKRADLKFTKGEKYYVVVYCPTDVTAKGVYSISVGEPRTVSATKEWEIHEQTVVKGTTYTWNFNVTTPTNNPGYADKIRYSGSGAGWPYEGGYYSVLSPGTSTWVRNPSKYAREIKYNYTNLNSPLVNAVGQWKLRFTAQETGTYPGATLMLTYYYEI